MHIPEEICVLEGRGFISTAGQGGNLRVHINSRIEGGHLREIKIGSRGRLVCVLTGSVASCEGIKTRR